MSDDMRIKEPHDLPLENMPANREDAHHILDAFTNPNSVAERTLAYTDLGLARPKSEKAETVAGPGGTSQIVGQVSAHLAEHTTKAHDVLVNKDAAGHVDLVSSLKKVEVSLLFK